MRQVRGSSKPTPQEADPAVRTKTARGKDGKKKEEKRKKKKGKEKKKRIREEERKEEKEKRERRNGAAVANAKRGVQGQRPWPPGFPRLPHARPFIS